MLNTLISYLPSGLTLFSSSLLLLVGIGLLVYQYFYLLPHRALALLAGSLLIASSMYLGGAGNQKAIQEYQTLENRLTAASEALKLSKQLSTVVTKDQDQAAVDNKSLETLQEKIDALKNKTGADVCFDATDTDSLRNLWK